MVMIGMVSRAALWGYAPVNVQSSRDMPLFFSLEMVVFSSTLRGKFVSISFLGERKTWPAAPGVSGVQNLLFGNDSKLLLSAILRIPVPNYYWSCLCGSVRVRRTVVCLYRVRRMLGSALVTTLYTWKHVVNNLGPIRRTALLSFLSSRYGQTSTSWRPRHYPVLVVWLLG